MVRLISPVTNWGTVSITWFEFSDSLQACIKPWVTSMLMELPLVIDRKLYRKRMTKAAMAAACSENIWAKSTVGHTSFYMYVLNGKWRCGIGRDVHAQFLIDAQADIIAAVEAFNQVK